MSRVAALMVLMSGATALFGAEDPVTFKTDVSLTRVDARVTDGQGRVITGLGVQDFVLTLQGKPLALKNVASEDVPIDILLLLDVSGSMEPHVQRIATAARQALNVLAEQDRVAVMIFDSRTRLRLPFRSNHGEVVKELNRILESEHFAGGTRITSALLDAARYMSREARPDARRAIVILTDDETQDEEDESLVERMLARGNTVLSFLQAPYQDVMRGMGGPQGGGGGGRRGGTWGTGSGGWPNGGGLGWPNGRGGGGGGNYPIGIGDRSHTAGTAMIAEDSGGDTMRVTEASALEDTLARLRQSYALYCYLPAGETLDNGQVIRVDLSQETQILHATAVVQSRRVFMSDTAPAAMGPTTTTRANPNAAVISQNTGTASTTSQPAQPVNQTRRGQRRAVNEDSGAKVNTVSPPEDR